ncbi:RuBisCO large subunit C-terminal-like domain-containing protein [Natrinema sp. SYSU A 869]|uniref:RuBisCO large subunit C-terminal-like domain-containing protein n=1 Tax=Natrinema sp. SYSU A 869 TaxID=2871694 RepID=UPI0031F2F32A
MPDANQYRRRGDACVLLRPVGRASARYVRGAGKHRPHVPRRGGILGHPNGPQAGVAHLKQGWEAAMRGIPLEEYAETHEELRTAIDYYGDND